MSVTVTRWPESRRCSAARASAAGHEYAHIGPVVRSWGDHAEVASELGGDALGEVGLLEQSRKFGMER